GSAATSACRPRRRSASSPSGSRMTAGSRRARFASWWRAPRWRESAASATPCARSTRSSGRRAHDRQPPGGRGGDRRVLRRAARFRPGPLFTDLLLADEINRASAKTQAALLEAMQERAATVDGTRHPLGPHFAVFATQNPVEQEGTYPLPEAELDRFLFKIVI